MVEEEEEEEVMVNYLEFIDYLEFKIIACDMIDFLKNLRDYEKWGCETAWQQGNKGYLTHTGTVLTTNKRTIAHQIINDWFHTATTTTPTIS